MILFVHTLNPRLYVEKKHEGCTDKESTSRKIIAVIEVEENAHLICEMEGDYGHIGCQLKDSEKCRSPVKKIN